MHFLFQPRCTWIARLALGLADDLARLIDDMTTRQVDWNDLDRLVPDQYDKFWQLSLDFLKRI